MGMCSMYVVCVCVVGIGVYVYRCVYVFVCIGVHLLSCVSRISLCCSSRLFCASHCSSSLSWLRLMDKLMFLEAYVCISICLY
jgi:hypothetical protein